MTFDDIRNGVDPGADKSRGVRIEIGGEVVAEHDFLCDACSEIVSRYVRQIARRLDKKSSLRTRTSGDEDVDVEVLEDLEE